MLVKSLTGLTVTDLLSEYKRTFRDYWEEHEGAVKVFRKQLIESALYAEQEIHMNCKPYKRSAERQDYRNGYWKRWITLKDGRLEIRMPRIRGIAYESAIIPRYKQRVKEVDAALMKIFLYGASTRLTGEALRPLLGDGVGAQTVSNITKRLDIEVNRFHNRKLEDKYLYLFLDGVMLKIKTGFGSKKKAILVAYGIRVDGKRELIDFVVASHESENRWRRFLEYLSRRGITGEAFGLVVTDGNPDLRMR